MSQILDQDLSIIDSQVVSFFSAALMFAPPFLSYALHALHKTRVQEFHCKLQQQSCFSTVWLPASPPTCKEHIAQSRNTNETRHEYEMMHQLVRPEGWAALNSFCTTSAWVTATTTTTTTTSRQLARQLASHASREAHLPWLNVSTAAGQISIVFFRHQCHKTCRTAPDDVNGFC